MDFLLILLILFVIAVVVTTLLYVYDSRFEFVESTWEDVRAWFKSGKNQTYVISGTVLFVIMLVLVFFIRRANNKHSTWIKSHDNLIEMEDAWLTNVRLIKTDGIKGLDQNQLSKFNREVAENEKDIRTIEHIIADRKVSPDQYAKLSQQQKREENDFISDTRKMITQRNESIKGFLVRNEKKLGKSAAKIAKKDVKESQKLATNEIRDLKKELANANSSGAVMLLEDRISQLEDEKAALKFRLDLKMDQLKPIVMDMPSPLEDISDFIDKVEQGGGSTFGSLEAELEALDEEFNSILHSAEQGFEDDVLDPLEKRYKDLQRETVDLNLGQMGSMADKKFEELEHRA